MITKVWNAALCRIDKNKGKSRFTDKAIGFLEGILLNNAILSFAKGLSAVTVFKAASFMMSITVSVIIARTLGPEATGTIGVVQTAANFLIIPMVMGVSASASKYFPSADETEKKEMMSTVLLMNVLLVIIFSFAYLSISSLVTDTLKLIAEDLWQYSIVIAVIINLGCITEGFMRGSKSFYQIGLYRFVSLAVFLLIVIWRVLVNKSISMHHYFSAVCVYQMVFAILAFLHLRIRPTAFSHKYAVRLYRYGIATMFCWALTSIVSGIDIFMVKYFCSARDVGIFSAYVLNAKTIFNLLFFDMFLIVFQPTIADIDKTYLIQKLDKWTVVLFPAFITGASFLTVLVILLFGSQFPLRPEYILFTALGMALSGLCQLYGAIVAMEGNHGVRLCLISTALTTPVLAFIQYFCIRFNGIDGAVLSYAAIHLLNLIFFRLLIKYKFNKTARNKGFGG